MHRYFESFKNDAGLGGKSAGFDAGGMVSVTRGAVRAAKSVAVGACTINRPLITMHE